jgi:SDR family mycofactocin-dependent oxidoreductase
MGALENRVALITGGARGQGRTHAVALAQEGADIVLCDIAENISTVGYDMATPEDLEETVRLVEKEGRRALGLVADMRDTAQVQKVVDTTIKEFGSIDILCANHGVMTYATVEDTTDEEWQNIIDINLTGIFKVTRAVIPHMRRQGFGRIICTASHAARRGFGNIGAYTASKWGIVGFVKCAAYDVAGSGITVNAICPTFVDTAMVQNPGTYKIFCPEMDNPTRADIEARIADPFGPGWYPPEEVSRLVVYIATDTRGVLTGQVHDVGYGLMAAMNT